MQNRANDELETPITSMIDIVFLLIIFFVVTASVDKDMVDESIMLAEARKAPAVETNDPRMVIINVNNRGQINIALQPVTLNQLEQMLLALKIQAGDSLPLLIRCDGTTKFDYIDRVMQRASKVRLYRVRIAAMLDG